MSREMPARPVQPDHRCQAVYQDGEGDHAVPGGGAGGTAPARQPHKDRYGYAGCLLEF